MAENSTANIIYLGNKKNYLFFNPKNINKTSKMHIGLSGEVQQCLIKSAYTEVYIAFLFSVTNQPQPVFVIIMSISTFFAKII